MKPSLIADAATLANYSVAVHYMRLLTGYAAHHGLPEKKLLAMANIVPMSLDDPNNRVRYADFSRACDLTADLLQDADLGLKLGQNIRLGHLGSHGLAMMSCSTTQELIQQSARYSALTMDVGHNEFEIRGKECIRHWCSNLPNGMILGRLQESLNQASSVALIRWIVDREDLNPSWVSFQHAKPDNIQAYEALFRCPLRFSAQETAIGFPVDYLNLPLPHADAQMNRMMRDVCAQLIQKLGNALEPSWLAIARKTVLESFKHGLPNLEDVAKATSLSKDYLREAFEKRGTSFRAFVDELRHALALGYIHDSRLSLVDIAYLLGFSEQSAFQRAFKRWTGMTPGEYRHSLR